MCWYDGPPKNEQNQNKWTAWLRAGSRRFVLPQKFQKFSYLCTHQGNDCHWNWESVFSWYCRTVKNEILGFPFVAIVFPITMILPPHLGKPPFYSIPAAAHNLHPRTRQAAICFPFFFWTGNPHVCCILCRAQRGLRHFDTAQMYHKGSATKGNLPRGAQK